MCLTCGCDEPANDHGDPRHVTSRHVQTSATVDGIDMKTAEKRVKKALKKARKQAEA